MTMKTILSVDVDHFPGSEVGIERIFDILEKRDIKAMFFVAGKFAEEYKGVIKEIEHKGHELGCHGYSHGLDITENFVDIDVNEQRNRIKMTSDILKGITSKDVKIFRAPFAMVNSDTLTALEDLGYICDSSVASMRFDFGLGVSNNMKAFFAPTKPYHPSKQNIFKRGDSSLLEIPLSAFIAPQTLSGIRMLGVKRICHLYNISSHFFDPVVFLLHPYEVMEMDEIQLWEGLPKRHKKNRGKKAMEGLEIFLDHVERRSEFILYKDILEAEKNHDEK
jgi:peptidoglycan/xylan/chitin deacetylase (PgdA/CDA1 family)